MTKILFTGGGTAGHVTLNLGLMPLFIEAGCEVVYIGSKTGIENEMVRRISGVRFHQITTGKLRRYFSWENFKDALRVPLGIIEAFKIIRQEKPDVIFSKGGFVSFPVVVAGWLAGCRKIYMHESDVTPGLANKMSLPFVKIFFTTFSDTEKYVRKKEKVKYVGPVLTDRLFGGSKDKARELCYFDDSKPVILFVGGSLGAKSINAAVTKNLETLLEKYQVIHICGKGQCLKARCKGYIQFEFVDREFKDLLALADVVISRSGSNAIFEFLSLNKPMLLVPLPTGSSRGEQALNAQSFKDKGFAEVVKDEDISADLAKAVDEVFARKDEYIANMEKAQWHHTSNTELYQFIKDDANI